MAATTDSPFKFSCQEQNKTRVWGYKGCSINVYSSFFQTYILERTGFCFWFFGDKTQLRGTGSGQKVGMAVGWGRRQAKFSPPGGEPLFPKGGGETLLWCHIHSQNGIKFNVILGILKLLLRTDPTVSKAILEWKYSFLHMLLVVNKIGTGTRLFLCVIYSTDQILSLVQ